MSKLKNHHHNPKRFQRDHAEKNHFHHENKPRYFNKPENQFHHGSTHRYDQHDKSEHRSGQRFDRSHGFRHDNANHGGFDHRSGGHGRFKNHHRSGGFHQRKQYDDNYPPIVPQAELGAKIKAALIELLTHDPLPIPRFALIAKTINYLKANGVRVFIERGHVLHVLNELVAVDQVTRNTRDKYFLSYADYPEVPNSEAVGVFQMNLRGNFGFVRVAEQDVSYFVHKKNFHEAIDGDLVEFVLLDTSASQKRVNTNNLDAKITKVIERAKDQYVGEVFIDEAVRVINDAYYVVLDNPKISQRIYLDNPMGLVAGHKVLVKITNFGQPHFHGHVLRVLGHKNDVGVDIESIVCDFGLEMNFPVAVQKAVSELDHSLTQFEQQKARVDLRDVPFVTIDPATSKDFDDAVYVEKHHDHYLLRVGIADVASYVPWKSALDEDAQMRGTSVYLVNSVIPMLPHILSNDLCSLNPHQDRCAVVCDLKINFAGEVQWSEVAVFPAIIKSHHRFSYDEVNDYFTNKSMCTEVDPVVLTHLNVAHELFHLMQQEKERRGYVNFNLPEPKIIVDEQNVPVEITIYERGDSQMMIENFMVAANEGVAYFMQQKSIATIYRVHEKPALEKLENFRLVAKTLNFSLTTKISEDIHSGDIAKWLRDNPNLKNERLVHMLLLRCMEKARYSEQNLNHFGLASSHYLHFTSPIRRYPDLVVHRLLWMNCFEPEKYTLAQRNELKNELPYLALLASQKETVAVEAERAVNAYKFAEYMSKFSGHCYDGFVTSVNAKGFYVQLHNAIEGFVALRNCALDYFEFNPDHAVLVGKNTKAQIHLGTNVNVKVLETNLQLRSIDFGLEAILD